MADFKKLTATEVSSKRFTPVRMREGYSMDEVDEFLEAVEGTINSFNSDAANLQLENEALKTAPKPPVPSDESIARIKSLEAELSTAQQEKTALQESVRILTEQLTTAQREAQEARASAASAEAAASAASAASSPATMDIAGASSTVARMLETAARAHDELVSEGQVESDRLKREAQIASQALIATTNAEVQKRIQEAEIAKNEAYAALAGQKKDLEDAVAILREVEANSRRELVAHYSSTLETLKTIPLITETEPPATHPHRPPTSDIPSFNA